VLHHALLVGKLLDLREELVLGDALEGVLDLGVQVGVEVRDGLREATAFFCAGVGCIAARDSDISVSIFPCSTRAIDYVGTHGCAESTPRVLDSGSAMVMLERPHSWS
jgi:hypothetical protein